MGVLVCECVSVGGVCVYVCVCVYVLGLDLLFNIYKRSKVYDGTELVEELELKKVHTHI